MGGGKISENPRFGTFFKANPTCAELVSDLETIAEQARSLFEPVGDEEGLEPSDEVWSNIRSQLAVEGIETPPDGGKD
jgi:hypothetical protein